MAHEKDNGQPPRSLVEHAKNENVFCSCWPKICVQLSWNPSMRIKSKYSGSAAEEDVTFTDVTVKKTFYVLFFYQEQFSPLGKIKSFGSNSILCHTSSKL